MDIGEPVLNTQKTTILERLAQLNAKKTPKRVLMPDGLLSISDGVMQATLYRLGMDASLINEPVEKREDILNGTYKR